MSHVDDMHWCRWCQQTRAVGHADCAGGLDAPPCPDLITGNSCGICSEDLAAQAADLGSEPSPRKGTP